MDKEELKKILKPLIKECIKEVMFETGVLSKIVSEVAVGLSSDDRQVIKESPAQKPRLVAEPTPDRQAANKKLNEYKKKFAEEVSKENYGGVNLFEGTSPLASGGVPGGQASMGPMANIDPADSGVDISGLMAQNGNSWKALAK
jgi:hypothetical protein